MAQNTINVGLLQLKTSLQQQQKIAVVLYLPDKWMSIVLLPWKLIITGPVALETARQPLAISKN